MSDSIFTALKDQIMSLWSQIYLFVCLISFFFVAYHFGKALMTYHMTGDFPDTFVSNREKIFNDNKFQQIVLPKMDDYDVELAIPPGQLLHSTVQGNWGFATDANGEGVAMGVYRDGYSADGSIFKGKSGKRYKRMLEQGPYVIKYEFRKGEDGHDVKIFINEKMVHNLQNEGVSSDKLKVLGTNYANYNDLTTTKARGRRKLDYIKFIPKQANTKENFTSTRPSQKQEYNANKIKTYLEEMKELTPENLGGSSMSLADQQQYIIQELFDHEWKGYDYGASFTFYLMHKEIAAGIPAGEIIENYKNDITRTKGDPYFNKKMDGKLAKQIAEALGYKKSRQLEKMMEKAIAKIKSITFTIEPVNVGQRKENNFKKVSEKVPYKIEPQKMSKKANKRVPQAEMVNANTQKDLFCPKNCVKPSMIDGNCEKDIIRMVVNGEDKFYRKCGYRCKDRFEKDYVNYDKSGPGMPYDVKRDGCRYTQAHCV